MQALVCAEMEEKDAMENLASISLTQPKETILVLSKHLQTLQVQTKAKKPATEKSETEKKKKEAKLKCYCWTHGRTCRLDNTSATCNSLPK